MVCLVRPSAGRQLANRSGWLNLIGTVTGTASSEYGAAQMLLSAISIGTNFAYRPTQAHITGIMAALCVVHGLINSLSTAWLNRISSTYAVFHIGVLIAAAAALLAMRADKHDAAYVFTNLEPLSGWTPPGFSFFFGCLSAAWIMTNCDGVGQYVSFPRSHDPPPSPSPVTTHLPRTR